MHPPTQFGSVGASFLYLNSKAISLPIVQKFACGKARKVIFNLFEFTEPLFSIVSPQ
jgi:hypothetical protein